MAESKLGTELMAPTYRGEITPFITIGSRPPLWCFFFLVPFWTAETISQRDNCSKKGRQQKISRHIQGNSFAWHFVRVFFFFWTTNTKKKGRGSVIPPFFTSRFSRTPIAIDLNNDGKVPVFFVMTPTIFAVAPWKVGLCQRLGYVRLFTPEAAVQNMPTSSIEVQRRNLNFY